MAKYAVPYTVSAPTGGVRLTGGRFRQVFENNIRFLKGFDLDRMLYWYRVHKGKPAPGVPYAASAGHFENNLKSQTAGEFLSGAGTTLLWTEDEQLRAMVRALIEEMEACRDDDGFIIPIPREQFDTMVFLLAIRKEWRYTKTQLLRVYAAACETRESIREKYISVPDLESVLLEEGKIKVV